MSCNATLAVGQPFTLAWYPGDTASLRVRLTRADGLPFDLSDCGVHCIVTADDSATAERLWDFGPDAGTAILDAAGGEAIITPDAASSAALAAALTYPAVIVLRTADGERLTFGPGYIQTAAALAGTIVDPA